ncbi:MAG: HesB/IscA family protein [Thermoguttaceae bacterium]|jgi:iron-sulfur cluster assembly protein
MGVTLTKRAAEEVKKIMEAQKLSEKTLLRTIIVGGGCSGMQYSLGFDQKFDPEIDVKYISDGVPLVTEKKFALFLDGTKIDFIDTETAKGFSVDNPRFPPGAGCEGCGR